MRLIVIKDPHFRFGFPPPAGRTDQFHSQIQHKIAQLQDIRDQYCTQGLILTGDITDRATGFTLAQVKANLDIFAGLREAHGVVYSIAGNHDLKFASQDYQHESFYQLLVDHNLVVDITAPVKIGNYTLAGVNFTPNTKQRLQALDNRYTNIIAVVHEHLVPDSDHLPFGRFIGYRDITSGLRNTSMIIAGHLHRGFTSQTINGVTIVNAWNLTRLARDYYTISDQHIPQVTIIDTDDIHNPVTVDLDYEPYATAFIEKELHRETELLQNMQEFVESCKSIDIQTTDSTIADIPAEIRQRVEYYLNKAGETL